MAVTITPSLQASSSAPGRSTPAIHASSISRPRCCATLASRFPRTSMANRSFRDLPPEGGSHAVTTTDLPPEGGSHAVTTRDLPPEGGSHAVTTRDLPPEG